MLFYYIHFHCRGHFFLGFVAKSPTQMNLKQANSFTGSIMCSSCLGNVHVSAFNIANVASQMIKIMKNMLWTKICLNCVKSAAKVKDIFFKCYFAKIYTMTLTWWMPKLEGKKAFKVVRIVCILFSDNKFSHTSLM